MAADDDAGMDEPSISELGAVELRPRARARERWRTLISEQHESGLGVSAFCQQRSIPTSSFYGWRRKLADCERQAEGGFVPVRLGGSVSSGTVQPSMPLEVRLRGGRGVLVRDSFDRDLLVELIDVLEGLA